MRKGTPKKLKTPLRDRFASPPKVSARQILIDVAIEHGVDVKRLFTLPGEEGHCARQFLETWPDARVVGIDRDGHTMDRTELTHRGTIKFLKPDGSERHIIDSFYHTTIRNMVLGIPPRKRSFFGERHTSKIELNPDYDLFDMSYIDYCGKPTNKNINDTVAWISKFANPRSIIGVTFNLTRSEKTALSIMNKIVQKGPYIIRGLKSHEYASDGTPKINMCLVVLQRF